MAGSYAANTATVTLYRPVGEAELDLIVKAHFRAFPQRLPHQPIFYPVLDEQYAIEIARDWNTKDPASGFAGYVTRFKVSAEFLLRYEVHTVGAARHREYWIPADELQELNESIIGQIELIGTFTPESI